MVRPVIVGDLRLPAEDYFAAYVARGATANGATDRSWFIGFGQGLLEDRAWAERIYDKVTGSMEERQVALSRLEEYRQSVKIAQRGKRRWSAES